MRVTPLIAGVAMCAVVGALLALVTYLALPKSPLWQIAFGVPLAFVPNASKYVKRRSVDRDSIFSLLVDESSDGFFIDWRLIAISAPLLMALSFHVSSVAGGMLSSSIVPIELGLPNFSGTVAMALGGLLFMTTLFFIARWIAVRASKYGYPVFFLSVLLTIIGFRIVESVVISDEVFDIFYPGIDRDFSFFISNAFFGVLWTTIVGSVGYLRGVLSRDYEYLSYLVATLPKPTREILRDLIRAEAKRLLASERQG